MTRETPILFALADTGVYKRPDGMLPPPAEVLPHVVQLELTTGCSYNRCDFCTMYEGERFTIKGKREFESHVDDVFRAIEDKMPERIDSLERIFIGGGDVLSVPTGNLLSAIRYSVRSFERHVGKSPRRTSIYASSRNLFSKSTSDLRELWCGGYCGDCTRGANGSALDLVYWGLESGSNKVLQALNKGSTRFDAIEGARRMRKTRMSAMVMPGAGGIALSEDHILETAYVLNSVRPAFVTFMGFQAQDGSRYSRDMEEAISQGTNRPLTSKEVVDQTARMIERLDFDTVVGVHDSNLHKAPGRDAVGCNPTSIGSTKVEHYLFGGSRRQQFFDVADRLRLAGESIDEEVRFSDANSHHVNLSSRDSFRHKLA